MASTATAITAVANHPRTRSRRVTTKGPITSGMTESFIITTMMVVTYMMNRMGEGTLGDDRGLSILLAAYGALAS